MSDFTTQLRFICESYAGVEQSHPQTIDDIIANSRSKIFDFTYPIFDEAYKPELETKIINHFYTQEIGQETVGLFKQRLKTKMREIMPYYNQLYMSERLKFDPFKNADYIDLHNTQTQGETNFTSASTGTTSDVGYSKSENEHWDTDDYEEAKSGTTHNEGSSNDTKDSNSSSSNENATWSKNIKDIDSVTDSTGSESTSGHRDSDTEYKGSQKDENEKEFTNRVSNNLHKEADTPLGDIGDVSGSNGDALAGNSGYLSKVTQDINKESGKEKDTNTKTFTNRKDTIDENTTGNVTKADNSVLDSTEENTTNGTLNESATASSSEAGTNAYDDDGTSTEATDSNRISEGENDTIVNTTNDGVSTSDTVNKENTDNKQDYFGKVFGKIGSETYSEMLNKFRSTFLNIDMDVIHELEPLFMLLW